METHIKKTENFGLKTEIKEEKIIRAGVNVEEAIKEALKTLGIEREEAQINILDEGRKGFLGLIGSRLARVEVSRAPIVQTVQTPAAAPPVVERELNPKPTLLDKPINKKAPEQTLEKFSPQEIAENFLNELFKKMNFNINLDVRSEGKYIRIELIGENVGNLIGKRGQTLDSIQYLCNLVVNKSAPFIYSVIIDMEGYRKRRKEALEILAKSSAQRARVTRRDVVLEPMSRYDRHIIHAALQSDISLRTYSAGSDPNRYVVISPKQKKYG